MTGEAFDEGSCDGIHDEGAPVHHLCTHCFPDLVDRALRGVWSRVGVGDLVDPQDDEHRSNEEAEEEEME